MTSTEALVTQSILDAFQEAREGARRHHDALGDADPNRCLGDFLVRVKKGDRRGIETVYKAAMSETSGTAGGYTVPPELRLDLMRTVEEMAIIRPRATVVPMTTLETHLPLPDATTAQASGVPPYFGGIDLRWTHDGQSRTESEPKLREVVLRAWDLSGYALVSNDLLRDAAGNFDAYFKKILARAVAWAEDYAFLRGNGVGKPMGLAYAPGRLTVTRATAAHFKFADAYSMLAKLLPVSWPRALFVMHPTVLADLIAFESTTTTLMQANVARLPSDGPVMSLYGVPVFVSGSLPPLGTEGDVILCDPLLYAVGDRSTEIAVSYHEPTAMLNNQSAFRVVHRVAGRPWLSAPVTLADGTNTVSPYVTLV